MEQGQRLRWAVGFVVLEPVWSDAHWKVYRVRDAAPLVSSPATVVRTSDAELEVWMPKSGSVSVKVAYSPWLHAGRGCLRKQGEFTRLIVNGPGVYRISSEYLPADSAAPSSSPRPAADGRRGLPPPKASSRVARAAPGRQAAGRISPDS